MPAIEIGRQSRGSIRDNIDLMSKKSKKIGDVIRIADMDEQTQRMLAPFDLDGDGLLDTGEMVRAADMLKAERLTNKMFKRALIFAVSLVLVSACMNFATSYLAFKDLQELKTSSKPGASAVQLTEESGALPVTTGSSQQKFDMLHPASIASSSGPKAGFSYDNLHTIAINLPNNGGNVSMKISGYRWFNSTAIAFYLDTGHTLALDHSGESPQFFVNDGIHLFSSFDELLAMADPSTGTTGRRLFAPLAAAGAEMLMGGSAIDAGLAGLGETSVAETEGYEYANTANDAYNAYNQYSGSSSYSG